MRMPALRYLKWRALGVPATTVLLVSNGIFRGRGDTTTPLYCTSAGNLVNILLDPILIFGCGMGVSGAGAATSFSQWVTALPLLYMLNKKVPTVAVAVSVTVTVILTVSRYFTLTNTYSCIMYTYMSTTHLHDTNNNTNTTTDTTSNTNITNTNTTNTTIGALHNRWGHGKICAIRIQRLLQSGLPHPRPHHQQNQCLYRHCCLCCQPRERANGCLQSNVQSRVCYIPGAFSSIALTLTNRL